MAFNTTNSWTVGKAVLKSLLDRTFNNTIALKEGRLEHLLGGSFESEIENTTLAAIPGAVIVELDGTNTPGLIVEVHAMTKTRAGTGRFQLYNRTLASYVGAAVTFTNTTPALVKITAGLSVAVSLHAYELHGAGAAATDRPTIWGAKLIYR